MPLKQHTRKNIAPGTIGAKIKKIREYRCLTQKELGLKCGFSETTAQARIKQYESNQKIPREKALQTLTEALSIDKEVLYDADLSSYTQAIHTLFDLEEYHGLHPKEIDGHICLEFSGTTEYDGSIEQLNSSYAKMTNFLHEWYNMYKKSLPSTLDNEWDMFEKQLDYELWKYEYFLNKLKLAQKNSARMEETTIKDKLFEINQELSKLYNADLSQEEFNNKKEELLSRKEKLLSQLQLINE